VRIKILRGLEQSQNAGDFALLSGALFDTDPQAMQDWIGLTLVGRNPDLQKRVLASLIPALGLEGGKPFLPALTKFLADSRANVSLRAQCASTIAKLHPEADAELWNVLISARKEKYPALKSAATWAYCELGRYEELGLVKIPAGEFLIGSSDEDKQAYDNEKPQHTLYLPNYYIAKYPVTVDDYRVFVQESEHKTSDERSLKGIGNHPVVYVSWNDALAFAKWKGMTLPSEAEWEKAARGADGRMYPWGNEWRSGVANTNEYWNKGTHGLLSKLRRRDIGTTTPVGFFPQGNSPYGCADMSGNVWEWTRSLYEPYPYVVDDGREVEKAFVRQALRGGSFFNLRDPRCAVRFDPVGFLSFYYGGFRVCASPVSPESS